MLPKCIGINLSVLFAKDVVGTGRTMKALLGSIEKHKPNVIKVGRWGGRTSLFRSFQRSPRGMLVGMLFSESAVRSKPVTFCSGVLLFDHTIHTAHWTAGLRERKGKSTCFAVAEPLLTVPRAVPRSSWLGSGARAPALPLLRATELVPQ